MAPIVNTSHGPRATTLCVVGSKTVRSVRVCSPNKMGYNPENNRFIGIHRSSDRCVRIVVNAKGMCGVVVRSAEEGKTSGSAGASDRAFGFIHLYCRTLNLKGERERIRGE